MSCHVMACGVQSTQSAYKLYVTYHESFVLSIERRPAMAMAMAIMGDPHGTVSLLNVQAVLEVDSDLDSDLDPEDSSF